MNNREEIVKLIEECNECEEDTIAMKDSFIVKDNTVYFMNGYKKSFRKKYKGVFVSINDRGGIGIYKKGHPIGVSSKDKIARICFSSEFRDNVIIFYYYKEDGNMSVSCDSFDSESYNEIVEIFPELLNKLNYKFKVEKVGNNVCFKFK